MPVYEYLCPQCNGRFQRLVSGFNDPADLACPRCKNTQVKRAISRFATVKSDEARLESLSDSTNFSGLDEDDPKAVARWAKQLGKQLGEEAGEDWDDMIEEMIEDEFSGEDDKSDEPLNDGQPRRKRKGKPGAADSGSDNLGWG